MAKNVRVTWTHPTVRESGRPIRPEDIAGFELSVSADGGANYGVLDTYPRATLETVVNELEPGTWFFQGVWIDTNGGRSIKVTASIVIAEDVDTTPPGTGTLTLELAA